MLYFDHCATTPPDEEVIRSVTEVMQTYYGNPSSIHNLGMEAERLLNRSREVIARALAAQPEEIIFTSGGTESNNLAIKGTVMRYSKRGRHLITTQIEHPSVYDCCRQLQAFGFEVTFLPVDGSGRVDLELLRSALRDDTIVVSVMHVNNEVGTVQPIREIGKMLKAYPRILFHVDAIQSFAKLPLRPQDWGIDLLSISAHKIRGPKGIGALYRRRGRELEPLLSGGGQEFGFRSGTENVPLIVGMAKAVRLAMEKREYYAHDVAKLRSLLLERLRDIPGIVYNGSDDPKQMAPHIVNVSYPGMKAEVIVHALEQNDIFISTKSACSSGEEKPSRVLIAMGADEHRAASGLRICLAAEHNEDDVRMLAAKMKAVLEELSR